MLKFHKKIIFPGSLVVFKDDYGRDCVNPFKCRVKKLDLQTASNMLCWSSIVTEGALEIRLLYNGLYISADKESSLKACSTMLKHWGFID